MPAGPGSTDSDRAAHWDHWYSERGVEGVSWYQSVPAASLQLIHRLDPPVEGPIIDVGGGASFLVDRLLAEGYRDLTVLDVSEAALTAARQRIGTEAPVTWLCRDLLAWEPTRAYTVWHDRAVFHFLTEPSQRDRYGRLLEAGVCRGGGVVMATFAEDGPEFCSGLPVCRYSVEDLVGFLGTSFEVVAHLREQHETPGGAVQPFTFVAARRLPGPSGERGD